MTKLVYEVTEDDVTRAKNQLKAMQLFGIGNTGGEPSWSMIILPSPPTLVSNMPGVSQRTV